MVDAIMESLGGLKQIVELLGSMAVLITSVVGLSLIEGMRTRQNAATFGFWSQLRVRVNRINMSLSERRSLLNNLYRPEARVVFEEGSPAIDEVRSFKELICETEGFLKSTPDQMPAYKGWSEDLATIIDFISVALLYDISDPDNGFAGDGFPLRNEYCDTVCSAMSNMVSHIDAKQKKIEEKITKG